MENYKEMYLTLFCAVEDAVEILTKAQQKCEDIYVSELRIAEKEQGDKKD